MPNTIFSLQLSPRWPLTRVMLETLNFELKLFLITNSWWVFQELNWVVVKFFGCLDFRASGFGNLQHILFGLIELSFRSPFKFSGSSIFCLNMRRHKFSCFFIENRAMASLANILLEGNSKFSGRNYSTWK